MRPPIFSGPRHRRDTGMAHFERRNAGELLQNEHALRPNTKIITLNVRAAFARRQRRSITNRLQMGDRANGRAPTPQIMSGGPETLMYATGSHSVVTARGSSRISSALRRSLDPWQCTADRSAIVIAKSTSATPATAVRCGAMPTNHATGVTTRQPRSAIAHVKKPGQGREK